MENKKLNKIQIFIDLAVILLSNLLPILGVIQFNWILSDIVILFIFEGVIIGIFNILKIIFANSSENPWAEKIILAVFFSLYHGLFVMMHWSIMFYLYFIL